jgi:N-acetylneuraminate synthase
MEVAVIDPVQIGAHIIGPGHPCLIIAEAGVNHNGDMEIAHRLIDEAAGAGADAVKFQSFVAEELVTPDAPKAGYQVETTGTSGSQFPMLKALELSEEQQRTLKAHCESKGVMYLCTPYENTSAEMLDRMDVSAYKVASTDTTNIPFLRFLAAKGRPVILSTGMCSLGEIEESLLALLEGELSGKIVIMHCVTEYPAPLEDANLKSIETMSKSFGCPVGFSDHSPGVGVSPWAVAMGAQVIEKHFTLDRGMEGPDHRASLEPQELADLVRTVREVEKAMGDGVKRPSERETANRPLMRKSLVAVRRLPAGHVIKPEDLTCKRPGTGLPPSWFNKVVGKKSRRGVSQDEVLGLHSIEWSEE